jgi:glycosyltransferase involved in cell wall biosynthesis/septal ring factor EnvC (AmiA/AmiB activator)
MPRVSIIMASYNHENYVGEAIQSVLAQTYEDWELIVTDDGSSDRTVDVIKKYQDPRIKLFCWSKNQGACAAANHSLKEAQGDLIAILNSDDTFLPNKLEKQVGFLDKNPEVGAVFSYAKIIDEKGNEITSDSQSYPGVFVQPNRNRFEWLRYFFLNDNCLCHPSVLIRQACYDEIGLYDERYAQLPDLDLWIRLCIKYEIHIIPENLVNFRINQNQASANNSANSSRHFLELSQILKNYLHSEVLDNLSNIFPVTAHLEEVGVSVKISTIDRDLAPFLIAMVAFRVNRPAQRYFCFDLLYQMYADREIAHKLKEQYLFDFSQLTKVAKEQDIFGVVSLYRVQSQLQETEAVLEQSQTQLKQTEAVLELYQSQLHQTQQELEKSQSQLQETEGLLEQSQSQLHQTQEEYEKSQSQLYQTEEVLKHSQSQLNKAEVVLEQSLSHLHHSQALFEGSQSQLHQTQQELQQSQAQLYQTQQELQQSQAQLYQTQQELPQLQADIHQTQQKLQQLQAQKHQIEVLLKQSQAQLKKTQAELEDAKSQQHKTKELLEKSQSQFRESEELADLSQSQLHQTVKKLEQSQSQLHQTQGELKRWQSQFHQVMGELGNSQKQLRQIEVTVEHLQFQPNQIKQELEHSQHQLHQTEALVQLVHSQLHQSQQELQDFRSRLHDTETQLENQQFQLCNRDTEVEQYRYQIHQMQLQLERLQFQQITTSPTLEPIQSEYKLLVWDAWYAYYQNDLSRMRDCLQESLKCTPFSRTQTVANWLENFSKLSSEKGGLIDTHALTNSLEWQQLMRRVTAVKALLSTY